MTGDVLDLDAYLRGLCREYGRHFPYAGVQPFRFPQRHAFRAVAQVCGSIVGRKAWMEATRKARKAMGLDSDLFEEMNRQLVIDHIIARLSPLAGRDLTFRDATAELADVVWDQPSMDEALSFLVAAGLLRIERRGSRRP